MDKKSGGKAEKNKLKILQKWDTRFFVLLTCETELRYYKTQDSFRKGEPPAGRVECAEATAVLTDVDKKGMYKFAIRSSERELGLRCSLTEFEGWCNALRPILGEFQAENGVSLPIRRGSKVNRSPSAFF